MITQSTETTDTKTLCILPLNAEGATLALVGGKGANLAKLAQAGFPVPGGFLVTTDAYRDFVQANGLAGEIYNTLALTKVDDLASLEQASAHIRGRFSDGLLPIALGDGLRIAYQGIGSPAVAVRSSATAEDLPDMSFAGQQDTYLNVLGDETLQKAVVDCWGSLWTARAIGYRARNGIDHMAVSLSVVVQEMVQSEASGVLFTANPLTGKRGETVIDATLGLGEALVSGQVEPDHYVVETGNGRILHKILGAKALAIRGEPGGGTKTIQSDASKVQALPDAAIVELTKLGKQVSDLYGTPQDIEWGWASNKLYLLQARPITSLFPLPAGANINPLDFYVSFGAIQGVLDPITPLGRAAMGAIVTGAGRLFGASFTPGTQPLFYSAGERLWGRVSPLVHNRVGRKIMRNGLNMVEPSIGQALTQVLDDPTLASTGLPRPQTLVMLLRFLLPRLTMMARTLAYPDWHRAEVQRKLDEGFQRFEQVGAECNDMTSCIRLLESDFPSHISRVIPELIGRMPAGLFAMNRLLAIANTAWANDEKQRERRFELTRGLPHNVTSEMDLALWKVAQSIQRDRSGLAHMQSHDAATLSQHYLDQQLPSAAQTVIADFLQKYGMRGVAEIDMGRTRWRENPTQVMQMVQSYLRINDPTQAPDAVFRRGEASAAKVLDELVAAVSTQPGGAIRVKAVRWLAHRMRALAGLRESPKFTMIRLLGVVRAAFLRVGVDLAKQGMIERADDLFFLKLDELKGLAGGYAIDWKALIAERRVMHEREKLRRQIPRLLLGDGRAFYGGMRSSSPAKDGVLIGTPVSPGVVEGIVHVVFDPHQSQLAPGEILVCPGTDPAWTPLFLAAGGLVMEVGGLMTHGSVVAREYGIPAVVGVDAATTRLKNGQKIRVDGTSGQVVVLD